MGFGPWPNMSWANHYWSFSCSSFFLLLFPSLSLGFSDSLSYCSATLVRNMDATELPNIKKWIVMYPVYINSKKTMAEGRRIALTKACENPTCAEIADCCSYLKLPFAIEVLYFNFFFHSLSLNYYCCEIYRLLIT